MPSSRAEKQRVRSQQPEAWVQQQPPNRQIDTRLQTLEPQRTEQAQLRERNNQQAANTRAKPPDSQ